MTEQESNPLKVSDIVPKVYIPKQFRTRKFAGQTAEVHHLDGDSTAALEKYATAVYRITDLKDDIESHRRGTFMYPVGEDPIHKPDGYIIVREEDREKVLEILTGVAFHVYDMYLAKSPKTKRAVKEVDEFVQNLFK
jgi:hypothetical protein